MSVSTVSLRDERNSGLRSLPTIMKAKCDMGLIDTIRMRVATIGYDVDNRKNVLAHRQLSLSTIDVGIENTIDNGGQA